MLSKEFIERLFQASCIQRWNDFVRPVELTELDKQAHKMMTAYLLAKFEGRQSRVDWVTLIETFIFEFLPRVVLTDIKAPLFHRLMEAHSEAIKKHVLAVLEPELEGLNESFKTRLKSHIEMAAKDTVEYRILEASHYLATEWEFKIVSRTSDFVFGLEDARSLIKAQMEKHIDLIGVRKICFNQEASAFIDICGQLRFQRRWSTTPRLPQTTVLGHSLFVAMMAYLSSLDMPMCRQRRINLFFTALFHDLPEVFTRDIISPIKSGIPGLDKLIEDEEKRMVNDLLLPNLPSDWHDEIRYYVVDPFKNKAVDPDGSILYLDAETLHRDYNEDRWNPVDGTILKGWDEFGAYMEAVKSIENGVTAPILLSGAALFLNKYRAAPSSPVDWPSYFLYYADLVEHG